MILTPDNPELVDFLIENMEMDGVFDIESTEDLELEMDTFTYAED